ncbi:lipopolysaccharide heptosyltransferase III [Caballeronia catudaia]|uniref:Lipopolysaccharide heptosyltransferase III n=2 Tax=Caballeronia catudaia TaxID=1777136 RepID=A0A157ZSF3_9BURK|nr:lipopolysaccharide heptosyltransferase III [Caballeronia catudaia]
MKSERGQGLLKKVDLFLGGAFLYVLGAIFKKRSVPSDYSTVGIFAFAAIGDSILSSFLISEIRRLSNVSKVVVFASRSNAGIYELFKGFDRIVIVPVTNPFMAIRRVREFEVDILIDTSQWPRISAILAALTRSKFTIGFKTRSQFRHYAYDACVEHDSNVHEVDNFRKLLRPLGVESRESPRITNDVQAAEAPRIASERYVVFHPWASGTNSAMREWPLNYWCNLAGTLIEKGYTVVITGGPGDSDRAEDLRRQIGGGQVINAAAKFGFLGIAEIINRAACVVCVNTGIMHLSAMLDTPMISLHGPTNPLRWGPVSKERGVLAVSEREGGMYLNLGFEYPKKPEYLMDKISVDAVVNALRLEYSII